MTKRPISVTFYEKTDEQKEKFLSYMKRKINNGNNSNYNNILLTMMEVVEMSLVKHHADFYVHDVELMKFTEGAPVLWIVRKNGTHFIDLTSEQFKRDNTWEPFSYFKAILHNFGREIKSFYLIQNGVIKKISEKGVFATLSIKQDNARITLQESTRRFG